MDDPSHYECREEVDRFVLPPNGLGLQLQRTVLTVIAEAEKLAARMLPRPIGTTRSLSAASPCRAAGMLARRRVRLKVAGSPELQEFVWRQRFRGSDDVDDSIGHLALRVKCSRGYDDLVAGAYGMTLSRFTVQK